MYHMFLVIRLGFSLQKNPKILDPSYKMDLDPLGCFLRIYASVLDPELRISRVNRYNSEIIFLISQ